MRTRLPPLHRGTQAGAAAETLRAMQADGIDVTAADSLAGAELDAWIDLALDIDFEKNFAEFSAERKAELDKHHGE